MWNIFFIGFLLCTPSLCDVSHLAHHGYGTHRPDHPLELPGEGSHNSNHEVSGYPKKVPNNPLHIPNASTGHVYNQIPDSTGSGTSDVGHSVIQQHHRNHHDHGHHDRYHGHNGRYNHQDDGAGWDIRKSVPGEPGRDYPTYDSVPHTSFTCRDKVPGYYADEEARCQAFSVCTTNSESTHFNFLCPNGTLFNQRVLTCDWWLNVDCAESRQYYFKNEAIGKMPTGPQLMQKVFTMLEAPDNNPYHFDEQQKSYIDYMNQHINDNDLQNTVPEPIQDYLPVPKPTPIPTTTTTPSPVISETNIGNVNVDKENMLNINTSSTSKQEDEYNVNQTSSSNVTREEDRRKLPQSTDTNIYIPPTQDPNSVISETNIGNVNVQKPNMLKVNTSITSGNEDEYSVNQFLLKNVTTENDRRKLPQSTDTDVYMPTTQDPNQVGGKQMHINQVLHVSNSFPAQKQQGGDLFVTPILSKPSKTDGQLFTSKNPQALFVSKEKSVDNKLYVSKEKTDGKLFTSELKPVNNPQALHVSPGSKQTNNKLFVSKENIDNKLFISELKPSLNPQPLFLSKESNPYSSRVNADKTNISDNKLFISPERTNNTLFVSPIAASSENMNAFASQINQLNTGNVRVQNELNRTSSSSVDNTATIDQGTTTNLNVDENKLNKSRGSELEPGYNYSTPQPTGQGIPSLTITKENTHTVSHSEKTTHVFHDGVKEPEQIHILDQNRNVISSGLPDPQITSITHTVTGLNRQPEIYQQGISGVQLQTGNTQLGTGQEGILTTHSILGINKQPEVQQQPISGIQTDLTISQKGISDLQPQLGLPQQIPQFTIHQQGISKVQPVPSVPNNFNLNKDQAIHQINQIQKSFQQITDEQRRLNQFGFGIINPRILEQPIPVTNVGHFGSASFPAQSFQGYQFPQPNYHYQQVASGPNYNIEFSKDGSSNNYNGQSVTQHTDGQTHTAFNGNNVAYKETTKVDIVPALGFHLNDAIEKSSYISALLSGVIHPGPSYPRTISTSNFQISPYPPTDVRYSSYQGPSSYIVPQASVPRLPSDSGYRYR